MFYRFAAALIAQNLDSWVMNVVPVSGPNTLPVIYDRGFIGVMHDWYVTKNLFKMYKIKNKCSLLCPHVIIFHDLCYRCESFDTYPRTYDLLHAANLLSVERKRYPYFIFRLFI